MFTVVYTCSQLYIHVRSCIYMFAVVYTCSQLYIHVRNCVYVFEVLYTCWQLYIHVGSCIYMFAVVYTCSQLYIHVRKCIYMFAVIYIHVRSSIDVTYMKQSILFTRWQPYVNVLIVLIWEYVFLICLSLIRHMYSPLNRANTIASFKGLDQQPRMPTRVGGTRWLPYTKKSLEHLLNDYKNIMSR